MLSILGFLAVLGPLVVVHELGHFIFARIFKVKAEIFSIGFGPRIWSRQIGETEWRVSIIPLGGYVKLLGEEGDTELSPELKERALGRKAPWKRFFIFFGGPLFNFLFAILVFMAILVIGEPQMASVVGRAVRGSQAEEVGFRSGDRILTVNGKPVRKFEEVALAINENPGKPMAFVLARPSGKGAPDPIQVIVTPSATEGYSVYGESTRVGEIQGLFPTARATTIGVSDPNSAAGKAGLKTGDKIVEFDGAPLKTWEEFETFFAAIPARAPVSFKVEAASGGPRDIVLQKPSAEGGPGALLGLHSSELFVEKTVSKSPAEQAGLKPGDRLIGIGTLDVRSFFELRDNVQRAGEKDGKVTVRWERDGKVTTATLTPTTTTQRDPSLKKLTQFTVGVMPQLVWAEPVTIVERVWNPFMLLWKATERMAVFSWRNIVSLKKMFTGDVSIGTLGGPILIGKIAGESISRGLIAFLTTMAILSVGLGVLNVLPVPVLDGGHLLLLAIESVRGKPLSLRQMEVVQQVGLSLILLLMVVVMRNDIARLPMFD